MKIRRLPVIILLLLSLSCNAVSRVFSFATPTPTSTLTPRPTPSPSATPLTTGMYVPPECQEKPLATLPAATTVAQPTSSLGTNPPISTAEQLRVFDALTKKITAVYLYPDFNGLDWPATVAQYRAQVKAGLDTETFYAKMSELVTKLNDDHSNFLSPVELKAANAELAGTNDYVGVGIVIVPLLDKQRISIISVFPGSSAEHGGLQQHDSILAVDGIPISAGGELHSEWVRGPECSTALLTIQSPGQPARQKLFLRYHINSPLPVTSQLVKTTDGSRIGYIYIPSFYDDTIPDQIRKALNAFGDLDGLILDNRMNTGGSSSVVDPIFSYFTSGLLGHFVSRTRTDPLEIDANPIQNSQTVPLVVLVGTGTVSYGEIFSGVLQDLGRAKVVGQTSLGNVETLDLYDFEDGSEAWIAQERFDPLHSHANWEQTGIIPDVQAYADWDTFTFENDPSVAAALKVLGHK